MENKELSGKAGKTIDVIIPVYRPGAEFQKLLKRLMKQTVPVNKIIVMQTMEEGEALLHSEHERIEVFPVKKEEFDHGATRDAGAGKSDADYILFMTQDAIPCDDKLIEKLLAGSLKEKVGICYARQLPRKEADLVEQMTREFNYPAQSRLKTSADRETLGIKTYFSSDVCAMYDRALYQKLGGFVHPTIFNEDMIMAYRVIEAGYAVYYQAEAKVFHSHSYTCMQQFHRNFDLGVSQKQYSEIFEKISSEKEGAGYAKKILFTLLKKGHFLMAVYFAAQCGFRLFGYKLGKHYDKLPYQILMKCTASKGYILFHKDF